MKSKFFTISIPIILLVIASFYVTAQFIQPSPKKELTIATGSKEGNYYKTALEYKRLLEKDGVKVNILTTKGSIENIELLEKSKADIGFIQNGIITSKHTDKITALASIYYEPLWVFYKNEGYAMDYVIQLISKKISIGKEGSGTRDLASRILEDNGISSLNSTILDHSSSKAKELLKSGEIDAMFAVTSHKSELVKELLEDPKINVLSIKRAKAYSRKYSFLESLTLHEGTLDLYKNIPDQNINLLATTANLVVKQDVSEELVRLFLKKVKEVHSPKGLFSKQDQFPNLTNMKLNINETAKKYFDNGDTWLETIFPYWVASNIDRLKILLIPLLTLMIPLFKGVLPLYQWSMRSKIYRWYDELLQYDEKAELLNYDELKDQLEKIEMLQKEIRDETKVPLSFMGEYYNLIMHTDLIIKKYHKLLKKMAKQ